MNTPNITYDSLGACPECGGEGWYIVHTGASGEISEQTRCEHCGGTGKKYDPEIELQDRFNKEVEG